MYTYHARGIQSVLMVTATYTCTSAVHDSITPTRMDPAVIHSFITT